MMQSVTITLDQPISQFVSYRSRDQKVQPRETVMELVALGFETLLQERYQRYRRGEISLGRLAQELGVTSWELTHLLESHGWPVYNLPEADK
jgi:hypothetical protein